MAASMSSTGQCRRGLSLLLALSFPITLSPASLAAGEPGALSAIADGLSAWVVAIKVDRSKDIEIPRSRLPFNGRVSPESPGYFKRPQGSVTGLLGDRRGYILTSNYNLLGTISSITVRLPSGEERKARVVARDQLDDLALIKVEGDAELVEKKSWRDPPWAETSPSAAGSFVFAIGRGSAPGRLNLTEGIISAVGRNSNRAVQTDATLYYGNVGGPLVDLKNGNWKSAKWDLAPGGLCDALSRGEELELPAKPFPNSDKQTSWTEFRKHLWGFRNIGTLGRR